MSTIAAIATAQAAAGLGTIKISGEEALLVADRVFSSVSGKKLQDMKGYTALYGKVHDGETVLDDAVALVFRAPKSYTGEDVVELSCHGGLFVLKRVLRAVFNAGAVAAEGGEFTKRAFLNGKMNLSEAEAVMSLISASGEEARAATLNALDGALSREIDECRNELARTAAFLAAWVDYPDDEIPELTDSQMLETVTTVKAKLQKLLNGFDAGQAILEGIDTAIVGRPNVGKSTLMNALTDAGVLAEDKLFATLDPTSRKLTLPNGQDVMLIDTVGFVSRLPHDLVKAFKSTLEEAAEADIVLNVCDASDIHCGEHIEITTDILRDLGCNGDNIITVMNKCDKAENVFELLPVGKTVMISALRGVNLDLLLKEIEKALSMQSIELKLLIPFNKGSDLNQIRNTGKILSEDFTADGTQIRVILPVEWADRYKEYII